nr:hypothetical protein [Candidatus Anoxychlamydiales bacterium]
MYEKKKAKIMPIETSIIDIAEKSPDAYLADIVTTRFEDAEIVYKKALTLHRLLMEKCSDAYLPSVAMIQNNLGLLYTKLGKFEEAENVYIEALTLYKLLMEKSSDAYLPSVAMIQNNLGLLYTKLKRFEEAENAYKVALTLYKQSAEKNHDASLSSIAKTLNNIGELYKDLGRFEDAENANKMSLNIKKQLMVKNDVYLSSDAYFSYHMTKNNIRNSYKILQLYEETENAFIKELTESRFKEEYKNKLEEIEFTAGYPGCIKPGNWYFLLVYIYIPKMRSEINRRINNHASLEGIKLRKSAPIESYTKLSRGTPLLISPHVEGFIFNPPSIYIRWYEDVQELRFSFKTDANMEHRSIIGSVDIQMDVALIGQIPLSFKVGSDCIDIEQKSTTTGPFKSVFPSYSHQDSAIVGALETVYKVAGIKFYRDVHKLHSGVIWPIKIQELIAKADIFQLYWSTSAKKSKQVKIELNYALSLRESKYRLFIRPLYWEDPMPLPPEGLE